MHGYCAVQARRVSCCRFDATRVRRSQDYG
eukprot:SAG25_NODE_13678_length_264_cov_0.630303_1_plen_29_part_10